MTQQPLRIGLIARADNSGLGMQTWEFYKHMPIAKTMIVDISKLNGNKQYPERYGYKDGNLFVRGIPQKYDIDSFLIDLDIVFVAEAPYNYYLYERAHELGVKTAAQYNYEFFDWFAYPHYPMPDMLIAPSKWHYADIQQFCDYYKIKHVYLHCPVNRVKLPFKERKQAKTFLHVAGRAAAHDRNGTETVIDCAQYLKSDAKIQIHFQGEQGLAHQATGDYASYLSRMLRLGVSNVRMQKIEYDNYEDIYQSGDVMILPRRYGGNCLPLNEALSTGMPVLMPDISPNNEWLLPPNWLLPAEKIAEFSPRTTIDIYNVNPMVLAAKIDEFAQMDIDVVKLNAIKANDIANAISWDNMAEQYMAAFEELCTP